MVMNLMNSIALQPCYGAYTRMCQMFGCVVMRLIHVCVKCMAVKDTCLALDWCVFLCM